MTGFDERPEVRNAALDRRLNGAGVERGTAGMDVATLLARTGIANTGTDRQAHGASHGSDAGSNLDVASKLARTGSAPVPAAQHDVPAESADSARWWDADSLAAAITELANRFTEQRVDPDTDFFDAGGTSLAAVELLAALARELDIHPDLDTVFFDARPRRLANRWLADHPEAVPSQPGSTSVEDISGGDRIASGAGDLRQLATGTGDLRQLATGTGDFPQLATATGDLRQLATANGDRHEPPADTAGRPPLPAATGGRLESFADTDDLAQLFADLGGADRLPLVAAVQRVAPEHILLTGATGFLGSHLLLDLLRHSNAHVVCLVRADDDRAAAQRLEHAVRRFALPWSREVLRRVTPLAGDLRLPHLGLPDERWKTLAAEVDSIVNAGAAVDFLRGYPSLRRTNVLGPLTLAELASTDRPKPLHHISSLAVFNGSDAATLGEDEPTANVAALPIGYDRSKWAAEAVLRRAGEHGLVVTILRPGGIGSHPETGAHNPRDLNAGITAALMRFRTVPGFRYLNAAPVDWVSRVAAQIVGTPSAWGHTYHLTGAPTSLEQLVAETTLGGLGIRVQHWEQWCDDTVRAIREGPVPELESLAQVLQSPVARRQLAAMVTAAPASATRTDALVSEYGLPAPTTSPAARGKMLAAMAGTGDRPGEEPYLRFNETLTGTVGSIGAIAEVPCDLKLTLSVASSAQVFSARTLAVSGELSCPGLHQDRLTVEGTATVRPHDGLPLRHEVRHPIMRYQLTLRDSSGSTWWLDGYKFAAARRRLVRQLGTQVIEIGRTGEPASYTGEVAVPMHTYLPDQIDGIEIDPRLSERQQRLAKLLWLSWFGSQLGKSLLEPVLRVGTDLLDLRRAMRKETRW